MTDVMRASREPSFGRTDRKWAMRGDEGDSDIVGTQKGRKEVNQEIKIKIWIQLLLFGSTPITTE